MSSDLYRSFGGSMRFHAHGGTGGQNLVAFLFKALGAPGTTLEKLKVWHLLAVSLGLLVLVIIIVVARRRKSKFEGFDGSGTGQQTASGWAGTFTQHRSQHSPRNRSVDNLGQNQEMGFSAGQIASGQHANASQKPEHFGDLHKVLNMEHFAQVRNVPANQNIVPIPAAGQANPSQRKAGFADFAEHFDGQDYTTNQEWLERRLNKKSNFEGFADRSGNYVKHNENNLGFMHVLPEQDYKEGGVSAGASGSMADQPFLNQRTMGASERPHSQRLVEGFAPQTAFDVLGKKLEKFGPSLNLDRPSDSKGSLPMSEFAARVIKSDGMSSGSASSAPGLYNSGLLPSSFASRNMLTGNPDKKAREVVSGYCSPMKPPACKKDPLCGWDANSKSCTVAKRPANECAFPVNPKYKPIDPTTGLRMVLPADACVDSSKSNFNKWVETDWVLKYDTPYSSMQSSDLHYKQLQNLVYNNPKTWDISKPQDTPTSFKPGDVDKYVAERQGPVGVDDTKLEVEKKGKKENFENKLLDTIKNWFHM